MRSKELLITINEIRRRNLIALEETWGGPTRLAEKLGLSGPSYLSQMTRPPLSGSEQKKKKNNKTGRMISEHTARKFEQALSLPRGWMDQDHSKTADGQERRASNEAALFVQGDLLGAVIAALFKVEKEEKLVIAPAKKGRAAALIYQDALAHGGQISIDYVRKIIGLLR